MEKEELTLIARQCLELEIDENSKMPICRALIPKGRFINVSLDTATLNTQNIYVSIRIHVTSPVEQW
jgi:hypothetical protein